MSEEDLRKLAEYVIDALAARLLGGGPGVIELLREETDRPEETEEQKIMREEQEALLKLLRGYEGDTDG